MPVDLKRIEAAVVEILAAVGERPDRVRARATPGRVARMYTEIFSGLHEDPGEYLTATFEADHDELVLVRDIALTACASTTCCPGSGGLTWLTSPARTAVVTGLSKIATS